MPFSKESKTTVCVSGRIVNRGSAHSQVIDATTMGVGSAPIEELTVDKHRGFFVNHRDVVFLDEADEGHPRCDYPITPDKHLDRLPAVA